MFSRIIKNDVVQAFFKGRVVILYGARQTGKTTLVQEILSEFAGASVFLNCDEPDVRLALENRTSTELKQFIGQARLVVIDEAQRVKNIGLSLKLIVDRYPDIQILATGSSSFELANQTSEPLTGRKIEFHLHPLSVGEIWNHVGEVETKRSLDRRLIFGLYPAVVQNEGTEAAEILRELSSSYLYRDVLMWRDIRKPELLDRLLRALALQVGSEVSFNELAQTLGVDKQTVASYVDVLEQAFVVFKLTSFSRNLRTELRKSRKIYFWDVGIRNALLNNLNPLEMRTDAGALWENFLVAERIKYRQNLRDSFSPYFWRTHQQQEVDYLEDAGGHLLAAEFKWKRGPKGRISKSFQAAYPDATLTTVSRENWPAFLIPERQEK